jgi:hypothetical protein
LAPSHSGTNAPPCPGTGGPADPGLQRPSTVGTPIRCAHAFTAREAIARIESQPDNTDAELEPADPINPHRDPAASQILEHPSGPSSCLEQSPAPRLTKTQKKNLKARELRRKERGLGFGGLKGCALKHRESAKGNGINMGTDAKDLPHLKPGWISLREVEDDWHVYGLEELQEKFGLRLIPWDGK